MAVNNLIQIRKGTSASWILANPILASGEPGYDLSNKIFKIGDGVSDWVSLGSINLTSSNITDFNSSVSGILPVKNIVAGTNVTISSSSGSFTINSTASGGGSSSIDAGTYPLISISSQPSATSVSASSNATFSVTATASSPASSISYQWQESTNNSVWTDISGSTSATLTLTNVQSGKNGYYYRCNLQSLLSNIYSNSAILTVTVATTTTTTTAAPTTTTTTTAAPSTFITLAYTAGSWSGVGTSASKYTTSSTFSPRPAGASSELLPFNFTATSDCEFYLKWSHYGVSDDNYRAQTTQILINGSPIDTDGLTINPGINIQGFISNDIEYPIWLTTGDIVTVRVYRTLIDHSPVDTYTSVSAYAVARTTSPMTLIKQGGGSPSWSGIGTVGSKYVRAGSTEINNIGYGTNSIIFTVKKSGTFYYTATINDYPDDNSSYLLLLKNGTIVSAATLNEGQTGTRSTAASVGDILQIYSNSNAYANTNFVSNISAWVE